MSQSKYRLVTRSDFDGLVCAVIFRVLGMIDDILFVHPKDMQDGKIDISASDITTNLPYTSRCHLAFDHHASEVQRLGYRPENYIIDPEAPSAARVVYDYYGGPEGLPQISTEMMEAVDKADSAQFSLDEILAPDGWVLLNYLMDARTGLGRFRQFRISNYQLMMNLIEYCQSHSIEEILELPDVSERVEMYQEHEERFKSQIHRCSQIYGDVVVLDLRSEDTIYAGNRFMIYALFPQVRVSIHALWGLQRQNTVFAVGRSILNRSSSVHIGNLMLQYGGGGHAAAGTCQVANDRAEDVLDELIGKLQG